MKKKLLLINPSNSCKTGLSLTESSKNPPLGLGIIAALTPENWKIKIIDENFRSFKYEDADLVGITAFTSSALRAYEIAKEYREKGIPTILGGIHASMLPDEARQFFDTVVIGEAESIWPEVISDFEKGKLKSVYQGDTVDMDIIPIPRHDLFHPRYMFGVIQTSRGCPMDCDFCSVTKFNGNKFRQKSIDIVLDEIESLPHQFICFIDDNLLGYGQKSYDRAIQLFKGMINRGIKKSWYCQASINFAENDEVLKYAAESGCKMVIIGLESENEHSLAAINKKINLKASRDKYRKAIKKIHKHKIAVLGEFIYGLDTDTPESLKKRTKYLIKSPIDIVLTTLLTPLPGTRLFNKFREENRLVYNNFPDDWVHFDLTEVTNIPLNMSPEKLSEIMSQSNRRLYNKVVIIRRFIKTLINTKSLATAKWAYDSNLNLLNIVRKIENEKTVGLSKRA
ncbi:MAG: B12-binding domain-containing radical SAM protein [Marinilabiliales bacterium]|nr:MAG: B12-binding domain-containing radical SAM protein [Marinilabiliales bacterium]